MTTMQAFICPEGTKADIALQVRPGADEWLPVQLKTANRAREGNAYAFGGNDGLSVAKYGRIFAVLWAVTIRRGWVARMDNIKALRPSITPGQATDTKWPRPDAPDEAARHLDLDAIVRYLWEHRAQVDTLTKSRLRWFYTFSEGTKFKELVQLYAYAKYLGVDPDVLQPDEQNGQIDLVDLNGARLQFKSARQKKGSETSLQAIVSRTRDGERGQKYRSDEFDVLMVAYIEWSRYLIHMWRIDMNDLLTYKPGLIDVGGGGDSGTAAAKAPGNSLVVYTKDRVARGRSSDPEWTKEHYFTIPLPKLPSFDTLRTLWALEANAGPGVPYPDDPDDPDDYWSSDPEPEEGAEEGTSEPSNAPAPAPAPEAEEPDDDSDLY